MNSHTTVARTLAAAFVVGDLDVEGLVERGSDVLGKRWRWLRPLAQHVAARFGNRTRPRQTDVAEFIRGYPMDPKLISTNTEHPVSRPKRRRLLRLASIGIVVVLAAATYRYFWLAKPVGSGPAGPSVPREAFSRPWTERSVVLLGVGDSVTAGLGASRSDLSYVNRLVRNPPDEFDDLRGICLSAVIPNLEVMNIAVSGSNSLQHLDRLESLEPFPESVLGIVVMTSGGNDLIHWYGRTPPREGAMYGATLEPARPWIARFEERLNRMLDLLAEKFPGGCEVFLGDIYDPSDGVGDAPSVFLPAWPDAVAILAEYNRVIHRCAEQREHVHLVPIHEHFLGHGIHCTQFWRRHYRADDPHYWYYFNLEDPNDRG